MTDLFSLERFDRPQALWLGLGALLVWWMARRSLAGLGPIRAKLALAARGLVLLLLLLAIAGTHRVLKNDDLSVFLLLDQSRSVPAELRAESEEFVQRVAKNMLPDDRLGIVTFDGQAQIEQLPSRPGPDGGLHVVMPLADGQKPDRTNLAQGLRVAAACALESTNNRVIILSDGIENVGDALAEATSAAANRITIDVVPLRYEHGAEVVFEQLVSPPYANLYEQVPLRLILRSDQPASGEILVYQRVGQQEALLDLTPGQEGSGQRVALEPGRNAFNVRVPIKSARAHEFRAEFIPDDKLADAMANNNVARAFTNVEGPKSVLYIGTTREQQDDEVLVEALKREGIRVQWEASESLNIETSVLQDFSAVVLANVPADHFGAEQQQALASYVRDLGGGLVMIGGDDAFAAGGWQGSVVEEIMPVKFDVDSLKQIPRGALAIVMHSCEMPQGNKWGIETAVAALQTISSLDYFGLVDWGLTGYQWEVPMHPATNKEAIITQLRKMQNSDMMDFETPMRMAYKSLMNCRDAAQRHMIVISDGDPAPPSSGLLNAMVGSRVTCSTISIFPHGGREITTLKNIAQVTGGRYYALARAGDEKMLPRIFVKEARVVRRPLVRDEEFTPQVRPHLSEIMAGVGEPIPPLKGYVVTTPRQVPDVEMPLVTQRGDPLLAHWLCGFGRTVAFTSGRWKHWGANWTSWPGFSKLWAQAVRWCMQQGSAANFDVVTRTEGDQGHIVIESHGDDQGFANFRQFAGRAINPDGTATMLPIVQTGPGRYEGTFKLGEQGTYLLNVVAYGGEGESPTMIRSGVTVAYSPEFRDLNVNEMLLREIAQQAGGRVLAASADAETVFAHNLPPTVTRTPIWQTLLQLAVFAFILDVAVRRIAVDPLKALATARSYIASLAGRFGAGQRAATTLRGLKDVRQRVLADRSKEAQSAAPGQAESDAASEGTSGLGAGVKFDAGRSAPPAAKDLAQAMGMPQPPGPPKPQAGAEAESEPTTARLLKAKKRAREARDDK